MKTITLFFVALCMLMASSLTAQTNLVPNGGFEQPTWIDGTQPQEWISNNGGGETESWTCGASSTYENPTGVVPAEGTSMYYIKCLAATTYAWQTIKKPAGSVTIKNGTNYIFKFKAYSLLGAGNTATPTIKSYVEENGGNWVTIDKTVYDVIPGQWNSYSVKFNVLDNTLATGANLDVSMGFILTGNLINTVFFIDDVQIIADNSTGLNNLKTSSVSLYPVPVINRCKILNGNFQTAKVFNLTGSLITECTVRNNEIDLSKLAAGCYMVKLQGSTDAVLKVVKK